MKKMILRLINGFIPKKNNNVFVLPLSNCEMDDYDIINYTADSTLTLVNYWMNNGKDTVGEVYLAIHFPERISNYIEYVRPYKHIKFHFINHSSKATIFDRITLFYYRCKSKVWITETVSYLQDYAMKNQFQLVLSYFTSCKGDYIFHDDTVNIRKYCANHTEGVKFISSSFLDSLIKSTAFGPTFHCFCPFGLIRNDNLDAKFPIEDKCIKWIESLRRDEQTKVILFAPTFRDYETNENVVSRSIWGNGYDDSMINNFLEKNNCIVIAKLHPWQNEEVVRASGSRIHLYKKSFDFSFYDVMKAADIMITDYSSIGLDWLLLDRPTIYNLYDYDKYKEIRGFSYEPFSDLWGGAIVKNDQELVDEIKKNLKDGDEYKEKRRRVLELMYNGRHFDSSKKTFNLLKEHIR